MAFGVASLTTLVKHIDKKIDALAAELLRLEEEIKKMATRADLDALKAALVQAISDTANRVAADIQALKDALAAGTPVTDQDLTDLQADITALGQVDPSVIPTPAPSP